MTRYVGDVWRLRHFWLALVRMDLRARYRRSILGLGWSLLHPIAMTAVLCTVFTQLFGFDLRTYAPFVLAGLTVWNFITATINGGCHTFFQGESYIRQHPAPLLIYPLRTTLAAGFHFLLGLSVVILFVWAIHGFHNLPAMLSLLPTLAMLFVLGCSLAICAGVVNVLFQDTQHLVEVLLQILFYLTPIIYSADLLRERRLGWFLRWNPLAALLELVRLPILEGRVPPPEVFLLAGATTLLVATAALLTLARLERRIIFYL